MGFPGLSEKEPETLEEPYVFTTNENYRNFPGITGIPGIELYLPRKIVSAKSASRSCLDTSGEDTNKFLAKSLE